MCAHVYIQTKKEEAGQDKDKLVITMMSVFRSANFKTRNKF